MYCSDNADFLPSRSDADWNVLFFHRLVGIQGENYTLKQGTYLPVNILFCPSMPPFVFKGTSTGYKSWGKNPSYGFNDMLYHNFPTTGVGILQSPRIVRIKSPSKKHLIADSYNNQSTGIPNLTLGHWRIVNSSGTKTNTGYGCFAGRHVGTFNGTHLDGSGYSRSVHNLFDPYSQSDLYCHASENLPEFYGEF